MTYKAERRASSLLLFALAVSIIAGAIFAPTQAPAAEARKCILLMGDQYCAEPERRGIAAVYQVEPDNAPPRGPVDSPSFVNLGFDKEPATK